MRLSESRVQKIINDAMERLDDEGVAKFRGPLARIRTELERVVLADLKIDDEVEREAKQFIARMQRRPPEGSAEYDAMLLKKKEELAARRGIIL
jgi:hypothetical protein